MKKHQEHHSKSTRSQQVKRWKPKILGYLPECFQQHQSQKNELIETRTQPDKKDRLHLPKVGKQYKSNDDSSQSHQQYFSSTTEEIEANIEMKEIQLKKLNERRSLNQEEIQKKRDLIEKQHQKINKLKSQIKEENLQLDFYEEELKQLKELETTPEVKQERRKVSRNIIRGQEKIDNLSFTIKRIEGATKEIECEIEMLEAEKRKLLEEYKKMVGVRDFLKKDHFKHQTKKIIPGYDHLKKVDRGFFNPQ